MDSVVAPLGPPEEQRLEAAQGYADDPDEDDDARDEEDAPLPSNAPTGSAEGPKAHASASGAFARGAMGINDTGAMARIVQEPPMAFHTSSRSFVRSGRPRPRASRSSVTVLVPQTSVDQHCECLKDLREHVTR